MKHRPLFLRFNTEKREERVQAFFELCKQLKINPEKYLTSKWNRNRPNNRLYRSKKGQNL